MRLSAGLRLAPALLIGLRCALGPVVIAAIRHGASGMPVTVLLTAGLLTDVFDGVIARRTGTATSRLRLADSLADAGFYICTGAAGWMAAPGEILAVRVPLAIATGVQAAGISADLLLYGRPASFHAYSAKLWGFTIYCAAVALVAYHRGGVWLDAAIVMSVVSNLDALLIRIALPAWQHDVASALHALRLRRAADAARSTPRR